MKHSLLAAVLLSLTCLSFTAVPQESALRAFLWLEEIEVPRALAWARAEIDKTLDVLQSDPCNCRFYEEALSMLEAKDRISYVSLERRDRSNFWATCVASGRVPCLTASAARTRTYFLVRPKNARFGAEIRTLLNGWRISRLPPAILCRSDGPALARAGQCICRREPAGRRPVWAAMARGGPSGNEAADMG